VEHCDVIRKGEKYYIQLIYITEPLPTTNYGRQAVNNYQLDSAGELNYNTFMKKLQITMKILSRSISNVHSSENQANTDDDSK
jgi:hypothetical protein